MKVVRNRLSSSLNEYQPAEQAAYRGGFSTIDHLHAVTQVLEKTTEYNIPLVTRCSALCHIVYIKYCTMCFLWFSLGCCSLINCVRMFWRFRKKLIQKLQNRGNVDSRMCLFIVAGLSQ